MGAVDALLGILVGEGTPVLEIETLAAIRDRAERDAKLEELAARLESLGREHRATVLDVAPDESSPEPATTAVLTPVVPDLPPPTDEVERLIDSIAEMAKSPESGYLHLRQLWQQSTEDKVWKDAHTARAARRKADIELRFATTAASKILGGQVA